MLYFSGQFIVSLLIICLVTAGDIYVDRGNAYRPGPLNVSTLSLKKGEKGSPLRTFVYYPIVPGEYGIYFFIPGFDGVILSEFYTDYLGDVTRHGFVSIVSDMMPMESGGNRRTGDHSLEGIAGDYLAEIEWMQEHLSDLLQSHAPGVVARWDKLAMGSHSAGADSLLWIVQRNTTLSKAVVMMGPFATDFWEPLSASLPVLMAQTEYATQRKPPFPACILEDFGYLHIWSLWNAKPKVRMEIKGYGHCDICNLVLWEVCDKTHICVTNGNSSSLGAFHNFTQGVTSGFLTTYLGGYSNSMQYVTNPSYMPITLLDIVVDI